jgi:hypothetical protein
MGEAEPKPNVSPEEQKQYDNVVVAALSFLYSNGATKMVVQKLRDESKPPGTIQKAIGHTCAMVLLSVKGSIEKAGGQVSKDVIFSAGQEVIAELMTIAASAGLVKDAQRPASLQARGVRGGARRTADRAEDREARPAATRGRTAGDAAHEGRSRRAS